VRSRSLVRAALALAVGLTFSVACSRSARVARPHATLPGSPAAEAAFAPIRQRWEERHVDAVKIAAFLERFADDPAASLAKVYLAFGLIDGNQLIQADGLLATLDDLPPGATRDLATVARARSLRLHGAPQSALESLRPLVGKIVDDADREVFLEELALSAIAAHDDYEALAYLDAWLRGVGEDDRERVRAKIEQILQGLPRDVLEQTYRTMRARGVASGYSLDTQKLVAARLAHVAVEQNDPALARWLVEVSGTSATQTGGDAGLELSELAASRRGLQVVAGRTVGLLLPTRNRELRDEAADVVRGVSWALDLPRTAGAAKSLRLVTRSDGADETSSRAALDELAGEGASVILAGFDHPSADRASAWSESTGVPVLLLADPSPAHMPQKSAFLVGERTERQLAMLADALVRHGAKTSALVVDMTEDEVAARAGEARSGLVLLPAVRCDVPLTEAGKSRFPVESWITSGVDGWMIAGPSSCARDVVRDVRRFVEAHAVKKKERAFAFTLEAGVPPTEVPKGMLVLSASAGLVPVLATRPSEAHEDDVRSFMEQFGVRPSWWTAIGRDGGMLAKAALAPMPDDTTSDPKAVVQRRAIVQAGLLAAQVRLWTTDDKGFGQDRVLPRALRLVTWQGER
jgi:hypothetical protein